MGWTAVGYGIQAISAATAVYSATKKPKLPFMDTPKPPISTSDIEAKRQAAIAASLRTGRESTIMTAADNGDHLGG